MEKDELKKKGDGSSPLHRVDYGMEKDEKEIKR
jgi:hypothetical protein